MLLRVLLLCFGIGTVVGFGSLCGLDGRSLYNHTQFTATKRASVANPNVKIAMFGDQGLGSNPKKVLQDIMSWIGDDKDNAAVIHNGDFDYNNDPKAFMQLVDDVIPDEVPYFTTIGNHDVKAWSGYQPLIEERERRSGADKYCVGETAVNQYCVFNGVHLILSGIGTRGSGHVKFIDDVLKENPAVWKICTWHKNQRLFQVGGKKDETGYQVLDTCRVHGAMIHTGHEHSFSRTKNMANYATQTVANSDSDLVLKPEQSFLFVTGLGGKSIRSYKDNLQNNPWWAATAAKEDNVNYGVLLCTLHVDGQPNKGKCEFPDVTGKLWDAFTVYSENSPTTPSPSNPAVHRCSPAMLDFPVTSSHDDGLRQPTGEFKSTSTVHHLTTNGITEFTFQHVMPSIKGKRITGAYLQAMPYSPDASYGDISANITFTARQGGPSVQWVVDDDYEHQGLWVSPDLTHLLWDVASQEGHHHQVTVSIRGSGDVVRVYAYDESPCFAPTLVVQVEEEC